MTSITIGLTRSLGGAAIVFPINEIRTFGTSF
jgi:hypothetical protein